MTPQVTIAFVRAEGLRIAGHLVAAREAFTSIVRAEPTSAEAWHGLGVSRLQLGDHADALEALRQAIALAPEHPAPRSALVYALAHSPEGTPGAIRAATDGWWLGCGRPVVPAAPPQARTTAGRRVRIGYLADGFYAHPIGFLSGWIAAHDRDRFAVTVYDSSPRQDRITARLAGMVDRWIDATALHDAALSDTITADGIDVLIDLNGHSGRHRLGVLARRPGPLMGTACGFATTGLPGAFLVADSAHVPPGAETQFSEHLVRLPAAVTFAPAPYAPPVCPPPSLASGMVTFGVFNRLGKITPAALDVWGRIMAAVPGSMMLMVGLGFLEPETCQRVVTAMAVHGIHPSRIRFEQEKRHPDLLAAYGRIDIALDTWPYTGGLTTLEALWAGVPVVAMAGDGMHSRHADAHLSTAGLSDLVATDTESYVATAIALARAPERLSALRGSLRARLAASPACDARGQARALEEAIITMLKESPA